MAAALLRKVAFDQKDLSERIVRFGFAVENEIGESNQVTLVAQLTGRSANLFLLDDNHQIRHALRAPIGQGQEIGQVYQPPEQQASNVGDAPLLSGPSAKKSFASLSEELDHYSNHLEADVALPAAPREIARA